METSQIILNQGLTFLACSTGVILIIVSIFVIRLLVDLSKLTKNVDETTTIVKTEIEPTLKELNIALQKINSIAQSADKQVDSLSKLIENAFGASSIVFSRAKNISGGVVKGLVKGFALLVKLFLKK